jgi:sulfur carrier protein
MRILVNDEEVEVEDRTTVAGLVQSLGYPDKGIAVAVDWTVIPRSGWDTKLSDGSRIEIVTAVQGG